MLKKLDVGRFGCFVGKILSVVFGVGSKRIDRDKKYSRKELWEILLNIKKYIMLNCL